MKAELLAALAPFPVMEPVVLVDDQNVKDIIRGMRHKQVECERMYDAIADFFDAATIEDIGQNIWEFLKTEMVYSEQSKEKQRLASPKVLLNRGRCDCKEYSLFIGGVVEALNRKGAGIPWCFRFVPSDITLLSYGHVFVVLDPGGDEVWVDPVLSIFDHHIFYAVKKDVSARGPSASKVSGLLVDDRGKIGSASDTSNLLSQLSLYQQGLIQAVQLSSSTSTLNSITKGVVLGITSVLVPGLAVALKVLSLAQAPLNNAFGVGSVAARVYSDITSFNVVGLVGDIFNGRTYNTDQYWGAAFYYFYVMGDKTVNNQDRVTDAMVLPALKWFEDRTGCFVSGRQHIMALIAGVTEYTAYAKVNGDTTTNVSVVQAGVQVAKQYWPITGTPNENYATFDLSLLGAWANTVGVFDTGLTQIAASYGETAQTYAAQTGDQYAINEDAGLPATDSAAESTIVTFLHNPLVWAGAAAAVLLIIFIGDD